MGVRDITLTSAEIVFMGSRGNIAAIVLAAGRSSRMGEHKLLLPLGHRPLVSYAVHAACASRAEPVVVVVGHNGGAVAHVLAGERCLTITNEAYRDGMATSMRAGLEALPREVQGALILLGDQPLVTTAMVELMLTSAYAEPGAIHSAMYDGQRGNPVYFPHTLFDELRAVEGDEGGRSVVARHDDKLRLVPMPRAEASIDVDTPGEYERLIAEWDRYASSENG